MFLPSALTIFSRRSDPSLQRSLLNPNLGTYLRNFLLGIVTEHLPIISPGHVFHSLTLCLSQPLVALGGFRPHHLDSTVEATVALTSFTHHGSWASDRAAGLERIAPVS